MICQRTGYCCINLFVVVVIPEENGKLWLYSKPAGVQCPNLAFDEEGKASCSTHEAPWFEQTPCHRYQNSNEDPDFWLKRGKPCMLGPLRQKQQDLVQLGKGPVKLKRHEEYTPEMWE